MPKTLKNACERVSKFVLCFDYFGLISTSCTIWNCPFVVVAHLFEKNNKVGDMMLLLILSCNFPFRHLDMKPISLIS